MILVLSNIQEAYQDFFQQLQEVVPPVRRLFANEYLEEDVDHVSSIGLKVIGTFSLSFIVLIALHTFYRRSLSISKFVVSGLFFIIGHDSLKTGDNIYKRSVKNRTYYGEAFAHGFGEKGKDEWAKVQKVREQQGFLAAVGQVMSSAKDLAKSGGRVLMRDEREKLNILGRGVSKLAFNDTIVFKSIFDRIVSLTSEVRE